MKPPIPFLHTPTQSPHFPPETDCRCQAHLGVPAGLSLGLVPFRRLHTRNPECFVFLWQPLSSSSCSSGERKKKKKKEKKRTSGIVALKNLTQAWDSPCTGNIKGLFRCFCYKSCYYCCYLPRLVPVFYFVFYSFRTAMWFPSFPYPLKTCLRQSQWRSCQQILHHLH